MVSLASNRQKIYYAEYTGMTDIVDSQGYKTGEKEKHYTAPQPFLIYVAPSRGDTVNMPFGLYHEYTNVMSTCDLTCPIQEDSILWIGIDPFDEQGNVVRDHNYTVTRRAQGLNTILFAIKRTEGS